MKKQWVAGLAFGFAVSVSASVMAGGKPFGEKVDIEFGNLLWKTLKKSRLVGADSFRMMPYETPPPHGNVVEVVDGKLGVAGREGVFIVKKNFGKRGETELEQVRDNPDKYITSITVMFRREKGYDPDNKNWFWAKYLPSGELMKNPKKMALAGRVAKGTDKACIACHAGAPGDDYVFIHDRYAK